VICSWLARQAERGRWAWAAGLVIAMGLAIASPFASSHPDGLQWVAKQKGFLAVAQEPLYRMIPGYVFPGVSNATLATILAGILGTLIVFAWRWGWLCHGATADLPPIRVLGSILGCRPPMKACGGQQPVVGLMHMHFLDPYQPRSSPSIVSTRA